MAAWVVISGSPFAKGKCTTVAKRVAQLLNDEDKKSTVRFFSVASLKVQGCIGCDSCEDDLVCIYQDDMQDVLCALDAADAVVVVSPIYFAGVPSQLKALLDRFQPYFWKRQRLIDAHQPLPQKRPLCLALAGEGGDPYGAEPAVAQVASPFALADFKMVYSHAFIGADEEEMFGQLSAAVDSIEREVVL